MKHYIVILSLIIGLFGSMMFYSQYVPIIKQPLIYELHAGISKRIFVSQLVQSGVLPQKLLVANYIYFTPWTQLKMGEYYFPQNATFAMIWKQVTTGSGLNYRAFTIIPGSTFKQIKQAVLRAPGLKAQLIILDDMQLMRALKQNSSQPEGMFLPETYFYAKGESDQVVLQQASNLMQDELRKAWLTRSPNVPYHNAYEALIAASLIEKEAKVQQEFARIAGVLVNRLRKDMLLQFDPTVIYGMGDHFLGKLNKTDLQVATSYNTYIHKGLPPTPIAMPSAKAIAAALHPEQHDYYYFVATGDGTHIFSKTLDEHNRAVTKLSPSVLPPPLASTFFNSYPIKIYLSNALTHSINLAR